MSQTKKPLSGVRALVMGLGLHGGGVATTKWLIARGAHVTATDKRDKKALAASIRALKGLPVRYVLGRHEEKDFLTHDLVVVNPGVPKDSPYLALAKKAGKRLENDTSLFFDTNQEPKIAVTGTRGKTTTTQYIAALLSSRFPDVRTSGNTPKNALLKEFSRRRARGTPIVSELSSWQLEFLPVAKSAPNIAIITNLYRDHLNRYTGMRAYANAKANIFKYQSPDDILILNKDNDWTPYFLSKRPRSRVYFASLRSLRGRVEGIFFDRGSLYLRRDGRNTRICGVRRFKEREGDHNLVNAMFAVLVAKYYAPSLRITESLLLSLPTPPMRQEVITKKGRVVVVNDSCATSPDGTVAALKRFARKGKVILIAGGTDKKLEYAALAHVIRERISPEDLVLLEGSATDKLVRALKRKTQTYASLEDCVAKAKERVDASLGKVVVLFSPGAASFEKFLHEFDRGKRFAALARKYFK